MNRLPYEVVLCGLILVVVCGAAALDPTFLNMNVQMELSREIWEPALLTLGMSLVVITRGIDLSIGSAMGLCSVALALCMHHELPAVICITACLLTGLAAGALNGGLISRLNVHPLLITLATYGMYRGFAEGLQGATTNAPVTATDDIKLICDGTFPLVQTIFAALAIWLVIASRRTPAGRGLYAMGHNEEAAFLSGIPVTVLKFRIYTLCGLLAAVAAVFYSARRSATAEAGMGMELDVITAVVVGGISIYGGRGRIFGALLGVLLIHETRQFVDWYWQRSELTLIVIGLLLIIALLGNRLLFSRSESSDRR